MQFSHCKNLYFITMARLSSLLWLTSFLCWSSSTGNHRAISVERPFGYYPNWRSIFPFSNERSITDSELELLRAHEVIPDVIKEDPNILLKMSFGGKKIYLGNPMTPTEVKDYPSISWPADPNTYYTLGFVDQDGQDSQIQHWVVGNILGNNYENGQTLTQFISSGPSSGSGFHRYVFVLFRQPGLIKFDGDIISNRNANRTDYSLWDFSQENEMKIYGANFYLAEYDSYSDTIGRLLGIE